MVACGFHEVIEIFKAPWISGAISVGIAMAVGLIIPDFRGADWIRIVTVSSLSLAMYVPIIRWTAPDIWHEVIEKLAILINRKRPAVAAPEADAETVV